MINKNFIFKLLTLGSMMIVGYDVFSKQHTLPTPVHEELIHSGIDLEKFYSGKISDRDLKSHGFDPIYLNHLMYGPLHPKYRRK